MNSVKVFFHSIDFISQSGVIHLWSCPPPPFPHPPFSQHTHPAAFIKPAATAFVVFATFLMTSQGLYVLSFDKLPPTCLHANLLWGGFSKFFRSPFSIPSDGGEEEAEEEEEGGGRTAAIQQPELESTSCIFNELMVRSDSEKAQTTLGYLVPLKATNEMNKCFLVHEVNSGGGGGGGAGEEVSRVKMRKKTRTRRRMR